ncbi:MAG: C69 family dipeptidase, partial [Paludibacter sp.]
MIKRIILFIIILFQYISLFACTNLLVGKAVTIDGSTLITYSADSYFLFGALYHYPAATYPSGTMLDIHEWDTGKYLG